MEAKGHEEIARESGIPLLEEIFSKADIPFKKSYGNAFYLGNWLRDLSQLIDPVATEGLANNLKDKLSKILDIYQVLKQDDDNIRRIVDDLDTYRDSMSQFIREFIEIDNREKKSDLQKLVRFLIKFKAYFKFCHPLNKKSEYQIDPDIFFSLFDKYYSQYFPHEHLDRPEVFPRKKYTKYSERTIKVKDKDEEDLYSRDLENPKNLYPNVYPYLKDNIFVIAAKFAELDHKFSSKFRRNGSGPFIGLSELQIHLYFAELGATMHGVEDFFAHSNFVEHACRIMDSSFIDKNIIDHGWFSSKKDKHKNLFSKRIRRYENPSDSDLGNDAEKCEIKIEEDNKNWQTKLKTETDIVTGFFDTTDTIISISHLFFDFVEPDILNPKKLFEETLTNILDYFPGPVKSIDYSSYPPPYNKLQGKGFENKDLTKPDVSAEVIGILLSDLKLRTDQNDGIKKYNQEIIIMIQALTSDELKNGLKLTYNLWKTCRMIFKIVTDPVGFITDQLKSLKKYIKHNVFIDTSIFIGAKYLAEYYGHTRIGSHSLLAKDTKESFLYEYGMNCAKSTQWFILKYLFRWLDKTWTFENNTKWINWVQLIEFFLRHPASDYIKEIETIENIAAITFQFELNKGMSPSDYENAFLKMAESKKYASSFTPTKYCKYYWEAIIDVNFHVRENMEKENRGNLSYEKINVQRKRILKKVFSSSKFWKLNPTNKKHYIALLLPFQKVKDFRYSFLKPPEKWFIEIMQPRKVAREITWALFRQESFNQILFFQSEFVNVPYLQESKNNPTLAQLNRLIQEGEKKRTLLQNNYRLIRSQ